MSNMVDKDLGWGKLLRFFAAGGYEVRVGFPDGKVDPVIVDRAAYNEFGTSNGVPARPFLSTAIDRNSKRYTRHLAKGIGRRLLRRASTRDVLSEIGEMAKADIQESITTWTSPPNTLSTQRKKGEDNPLVETGRMWDEVTYVIRRKSKNTTG